MVREDDVGRGVVWLAAGKLVTGPSWMWEYHRVDMGTGASGGPIQAMSHEPPLSALVAGRVAELMADGESRTAGDVVAGSKPIGGFPDADTALRFSVLVERALLHSGLYEPDPEWHGELVWYRLRRVYRTRWEKILEGEL